MDQVFKKLEKIDEKIERIDSSLATIDKTLIRNTESLEHHIYRTTLAEKAIEKLHTDLVPIKKHVNQVEAMFRFLGILSLIVGITVGLTKLFSI